jgi:hypothetical protein
MFSAHNGLLVVSLGAALLTSALYSHTTYPGDDSNVSPQEEVLQKYVAVSAQPVEDRIKSFQALSPKERSLLWRIHLALYLIQRPDLTKDQQNVVLDTLSVATPQLFAAPDLSDPGWRARVHEPLARLQERGLQLFNKQEAAEIFSTLGQGQQETEALRKYLTLSELRRGERKVAFVKTSAQEKSELWHVHFALNLAQHPEWNEQQRSIVLEAAAMVTARLYETPKDEQWTELVDQPVRLFMQKALLVFKKSEAVALFVELGGDEPKSHHAKPSDTPACTCSHDSDWCVSYDCYSNQCKSSPTGCGTMWLYPCDGLCYSPPEIN